MRRCSLIYRSDPVAYTLGNLSTFCTGARFFKSSPVKPGGGNNMEPSKSKFKSPIPLDARVNSFQQVLRSASASDSPLNGWEKCWNEGLTPWDLGSPTPLLVHLHTTGSLPKGRALIPGCGAGYDVVAIACPERHVIGIDISESAIKKASELSSGSPNAEHYSFLKTDFFTWCPSELFDLIFDYTFFCAIEPELRPTWARKICDLLKPDGELITLMYPIDDHEGGPPYRVTATDYEEVLDGVGMKAIQIVDNELAVAPRMGREKLGRWRKRCGQSQLSGVSKSSL
ncbi:probable thiol methyltransferase 2 [Andrographis paniculata]|uniref:probable thiol methyltransferase 2 n=1 Tax=Andrographis paniculata TaxID=175694 RepID=UPI0021E78F31|nr:probable thiol methyltransferase 2 [Andrographis paniculata]XP_051127890.1 probable thiol methyltransferase 2 [Andrographis paniculata]